MSLSAKPTGKRLQRNTKAARMHSPPPTPSYYGEEDLFFPAPSSTLNAEASAPPTPTSPSLSSPRSTSPQQRRFKKLSNKLKGRDELDFGCAGDWSTGPSDLSDRYYSSAPGGNRASTSSSVNLPSLTHSRGHSSSSEFSTYTFDSSLPPSPTPSSCASMTSVAAPLAPLSYTSRVPLTPRTAQRHRQADESAAVDALNHFFTSVRLSQIKEDVSPCATARGSFATVRSGSSPPTAADILLSKNHAPPAPPVYKSSHPSNDFEVEFIDTGRSTFTPLEIPSSAFSTFTPPAFVHSPSTSDASSFSNDSTVQSHSPIPDQDVTVALDELSEYFSSAPSSPVRARPATLLPAINIVSHTKRPHLTNEKRPTRTAAAGVRIGLSPVSPPERRVQYAWI